MTVFPTLAVRAAVPVAAGADAGTLGVGVQVGLQIHPRVSIRGTAHWFRYSTSVTVDQVDYDARAEFRNAGALIDLLPFGGAFRITAGLYANGNRVPATADPASSLFFGGSPIPYTPQQIGHLSAEATFRRFAPYLGIGFGNVVAPRGRWSALVDIGAFFQGRPNVSLESTGTLAGDAEFRQRIEIERRQLEEKMANYRVWPVLSFGLAYRF